jgi:hypothetical protein
MITVDIKNMIFYLLSPTPAFSANILLGSAIHGLFWLVGLFVFCFFGVHLIILATVGWKYQNTFLKKESKTHTEPTPQNDNKENKAPTPTAQEPIYYIVERKTKRAKSSYSEPKQIRFK